MKRLSSLFLATLLFTNLSFTRPAQATVVTSVTGVAALVLFGAFGATTYYELFKASKKQKPFLRAAIFGMMLLDGEQAIAFSPLNEKEARELQVSEFDRLVFNAELDQVNFIVSEIEAEMSELKHPSVEDSRRAWDDQRSQLSDSTFNVIQKIATLAK